MRAIEIVSDSLFSLSHCIFPVIMKPKEKIKVRREGFLKKETMVYSQLCRERLYALCRAMLGSRLLIAY